jgi:hypothetical protein
MMVAGRNAGFEQSLSGLNSMWSSLQGLMKLDHVQQISHPDPQLMCR